MSIDHYRGTVGNTASTNSDVTDRYRIYYIVKREPIAFFSRGFTTLVNDTLYCMFELAKHQTIKPLELMSENSPPNPICSIARKMFDEGIFTIDIKHTKNYTYIKNWLIDQNALNVKFHNTIKLPIEQVQLDQNIYGSFYVQKL